jgi:diaminohydroxyphosphoribosylaminopyrimidine deaminase/5-amino-6-(5-phosphoribosylamino)uracil reductase
LTGITEDDQRWLDAAARVAVPWLGTTAENPTVGSLVVDTAGKLLGRGITAPGGRPHAETQALDRAWQGAEGATLYVTLEPCAHTGRTPPCVDAIVAARIARVVCGAIDPDPRTAGKGIEKLKAAGIEVQIATDHRPSLRLHEGHLAKIMQGGPFVTAKLAVSPDGFIGLHDKGNVAITGPEAKRWTHMLRASMDAVMIGAQTARLDDPMLDVRLDGLEDRKPARIVLAGSGDLPANLRLFTTPEAGPCWVLTERADDLGLPAHIHILPYAGDNPEQKARSALEALSARGIGRVLVEGGAALTEALLAGGLVDRFHLLTGQIALGEGVLATPTGAMDERLVAAGLEQVDRRDLSGDSLRTFERRT